MTIDVYRAALSDIPSYESLLESFGDFWEALPPVDIVLDIMVVRDNAISDLFSGFTLGAVDPSDLFGGDTGNVTLATDIENLVLGSGETTIRLHGDAAIQGTVIGSDDGSVVLDYSNYDGDLDVDGKGGIQWEIIPEVEITPEFTVAGVTIDAIKYPGIAYKFSRATGIDGNRLMGFTQFVDLFDEWRIDNSALTGFRPEDNAVTGIDRVVLPEGSWTANLDSGALETGAAWHTQTAGTITATNAKLNSYQTLATDANAGVWQVQYDGQDSGPLAANATAEQLSDALNAIAGSPGDFVATGMGESSNPWIIQRAIGAVSIDEAVSNGATITPTDILNSQYEIHHNGSGNLTLTFQQATATVSATDAAAIETALETLMGLDATVASSGANEWKHIVGNAFTDRRCSRRAGDRHGRNQLCGIFDHEAKRRRRTDPFICR